MKLNEFTKIATMLGKEHKLVIEEGARWASNIKNRIVYFRKDDIYNLSEDHLLGLTLHEVAHIHYTQDVDMTNVIQPELSHTILNALEDNSIEHIIGGDYPNAGEILESTNDEVLDTLIKILPNYKASLFEKSILYGAARFKGRGYKNGISQYEKIGEEIGDLMLKNEYEILNRKQTADLMPLVQEIRNLLIAKLGEPTAQEKKDMAEESSTEGKAESHQTNNRVKKEIIDQLKRGNGWKPGGRISQHVNFIDTITDQSRLIGRQIRAVLKRNNAMEFGGRFRTGKLLSKRFVRVVVNKDRNPFARRIVKSNQSYAFAIASDISGSMYGSSYNNQISYAMSSMHMVGEALRIAGVPRSMIVFGENVETMAEMGKAQILWDQLCNANQIQNADPDSTCIHKGMQRCIDELGKIRAERKIMVILTDGSSSQYHMMQAHEKATKMGIECLGITIGNNSDEMTEVFGEKKNTVIEDTKNTSLIGTAFIDILKKTITKG